MSCALLLYGCAPTGDGAGVDRFETGVARGAAERLASTGPRPDTRQMTCGEVNAFVRQRGAVVMTTGRYTFRRFVSSRRYCDPWEIVMPEYVTAADGPRCVVQGVCMDPPYDIDIFD